MRLTTLTACLSFLGAAPALAQTARPVDVDVELVLAVDVSRSMSPAELEIQRHGYAAALSSDEVMGTIANGMIGRIAVTYVEWAGDRSQTVIVPWTLIDTAEAAQAVADRLTAYYGSGMRRTSISGALDYAAEMFETNSFRGMRRIIDVSGDGPNNAGRPVLSARADVLSRGIVINGLPLMTENDPYARWGIDDLDVYYTECVIGGPGAFVIPVTTWDQFADAVRRKIVLEIAGLDAPAEAETVRKADAYDCLVGEKIWQRNQFYYLEP
ncbi:DUF1194 domain-containing protein [Chachezhania sediminis]|uniref:DUF1194 domain-containing protein n=1 Tax=Chachezhania sediminis TaxID=2599291 RepID=UPI00131A85D7|nr:DUF1194 domain-containing protein [Chachezhania sediminis]